MRCSLNTLLRNAQHRQHRRRIVVLDRHLRRAPGRRHRVRAVGRRPHRDRHRRVGLADLVVVEPHLERRARGAVGERHRARPLPVRRHPVAALSLTSTVTSSAPAVSRLRRSVKPARAFSRTGLVPASIDTCGRAATTTGGAIAAAAAAREVADRARRRHRVAERHPLLLPRRRGEGERHRPARDVHAGDRARRPRHRHREGARGRLRRLVERLVVDERQRRPVHHRLHQHRRDGRHRVPRERAVGAVPELRRRAGAIRGRADDRPALGHAQRVRRHAHPAGVRRPHHRSGR